MWRELLMKLLDAFAATAAGCGAPLPYDGCGWADEAWRPAARPLQEAETQEDIRRLWFEPGH